MGLTPSEQAATQTNPIEPTVIVFETSPDGSLDAIVQHDERTVYVYLNGRDGNFGTRACWVRNLIAAPMEISQSDLRQGIPPALPRFVINHPNGLPAPTANDLSVVWFEEGNGIALFEKNSLLAVIPPWSGREAFHGYARDCLHENEVCWPMPQQPALAERIRRAAEFWKSWKSGNPLAYLKDDLLLKYRTRFGPDVQTYEVGGDQWPPLLIYRFDNDAGSRLLTLGMALRPQPNVELSHERPVALRRIELGLEYRLGIFFESVDQALELLAGQARYPWRKWTWLGHGHIAKLTRVDQPTVNLLFVSERNFRGELTRFRDDPVNLLWAVPITESEIPYASTNTNEFIDQCKSSGRLTN